MRNAIVFGGSGFLGNSIVRALLADGYNVAATYCSHQPDTQPADPSRLTFIKCDVSAPLQVASVFKAAIDLFGSPDVVINAAGTALKQSLLTDITPEQIEKLISVDLAGALYISREAACAMHALHNGAIIHISSLWGSVGGSCEVPYSAAKGGVNTMVKALAKELAPDGIRVNAIAPGMLLSPMNAHLSEEDLALFKTDTPLNCFITPEDIWLAIRYLIDSAHVTGQILAVDGGIVM